VSLRETVGQPTGGMASALQPALRFPVVPSLMGDCYCMKCSIGHRKFEFFRYLGAAAANLSFEML
jgi:hypothetical protein